ncbi:MAG: hypothetical protein HC929_05785 [Leptolyngbyaceae cyanobacterium SM2_5_2]|nr:hypothetical protein [Leptolyngbyaceae cyanobacterium SM2_5_2]
MQFGPPRLAGDFKAFRELTAATADPYGWSILLRLGLSIGLTLRDERTNDLITGEPLLLALQTALTVLRLDAQTRLLRLLLETLAENPRRYRDPQTGQPLTTYNVEVPAGLPRELIDLTSLPDLAFPLAIPANGRFLLPLASDLPLNLSAKGTNQPIIGRASQVALQTALNAIVADPQNTQDVLMVAHWPAHLFVELLVQPGRCFSPEPGSLAADSLLAMVQLSLRPRIEPYLHYGVITLQGPARSQLELVMELDPGISYTLIDQANAAAGEQTLPPPGQPLATSILQPVTLPLNGRTRLLFRYPTGKPPRIEQLHFRLNQAITLPNAAQPGLDPRTTRVLAAFASAFPGLSLSQVLANSGFTLDDRAGGSLQVPILAFRSFQGSLTASQRQALRELLQISLSAQDAGLANALVDLTITSLEPFSVSDPRSTYFRVPADLAADLASAGSRRGQQWRQIRLYLESINSTDPTLPAIAVPTDEAGIAKILPDVLAWSQRFFDASGDHPDQVAGPWLVTAYPRISTPSYASPDASGRLKYDHLLSDRWAHNYRYYIRPSSRYDLLWQSLLESPDLFPRPLGQAPQPRRELDTFVLSARSLADLEGQLPSTVVDALYPLENQRYIGESRFLAAVATVAAPSAMPSKLPCWRRWKPSPMYCPIPRPVG